MREEFICEVTADGASPRLRLAGEFDLAAAEAVQKELASVMSSNPKALVVDLHGVTFIDSTGLQVLTQLHNAAEADGLKLWITRGEGEVERVLRITGLDTVLPLVDRVPDAAA